jgi:hypothetical protein
MTASGARPHREGIDRATFYPHTLMRSFGFMRYFGNLATFLFPAALPLVGACRHPHQRAEGGGKMALGGDGIGKASLKTPKMPSFRSQANDKRSRRLADPASTPGGKPSSELIELQ